MDHDTLLNVRLDFGLTYCPNGDLLQYISDAGHFDENVVRFYTAELIEALDQLHIRRIIHRDLKVAMNVEIDVPISLSLAGEYSSHRRDAHSAD